MAITRSQSSRRREHQNHESMISKLPTELIYNILSRLPVKPLLRVKSVSKEYYTLIKTPSFLKLHQEYSHLNPNPTFSAILSTVSVRETHKNFLRMNLFEALDKPIDIELPFLSGSSQFRILGICNGLVSVIVQNKSTDIMICNPLTGEFLQIPDMHKNERNRYFGSSGCVCRGFTFNAYSIYFGFCMNADKGYELFRMAFKNWRGKKLDLKGEVYSLNTNTWREIDVKGDFGDLEDSQQHRRYNRGSIPYYNRGSVSVFLRGVFYWETTKFNGLYFVMSFNVEKKVLDVLSCPSDCHDSHYWGLQVIKEELVVVVYQKDFTGFSIWVLNEQERSWAEKRRVENVGNNVTVLGCAGSGQLVIKFYNDKTPKLLLYDADAEEEDHHEEKEVLPYVNHDVGDDDNVFLYTESLVSVNVGDGAAKSGLDFGLSQEKEKRLA